MPKIITYDEYTLVGGLICERDGTVFSGCLTATGVTHWILVGKVHCSTKAASVIERDHRRQTKYRLDGITIFEDDYYS